MPHGVQDRLRRPQVDVGQRRESPAGHQFAPHLAQQERVATGLVAQHRCRSPCPSGDDVGLPRDVVGDLLRGQSVQVQPPNALQPVQLGHRADQIGGTIRWCGPLCRQHENARIRRLRDQVFQELQGGLPRPVQVLQHQHQRSGRRGSEEGIGAGAEQLRGVLPLRQQVRGALRTGDRPHPFQLGNHLLRRVVDDQLPGRHRRHQRFDRLHERLVGRSHAGHARADQHRGVLPMQIGGDFRDDA